MRSVLPPSLPPSRVGTPAGLPFGFAFNLAFALVLCSLLPSCSRQRRPGIPPKNLLLITIDDLRPDHLSCYGYLRPTSALGPWRDADRKMTFDDLADSGVLFASAYAPSSSTLPSLASLFTGRGPLETGVVDDRSVLAADIPTLAEILGQAGFATAACITPRGVDPRALPRRGFESFETGADDDETIQHALQWLKRDLGNGRPFFLWLHLSGLVPDWKWPSLYLQHGGRRFPGRFADPAYRGPADGSAAYFDRAAKRELAPTTQDVAHTIDLYDGTVVQVLGLVSEFLLQCFAYETSEVEASECWARTLVVLTSPHGIELFDHGQPGPAPSSNPRPGLNEAVLRVPLVLHHPDSLTGERVFGGAVELQDLLPTVLDWFSIAVPAGVRGRSLLARTDSGAKRRFEERPAFTSISDRMFSVRTERWRLIWSPYQAAIPDSSAMPGVSLFDHVRDRWELHDVALENPGVVKELEDSIRAWRSTQVSPTARAPQADAAGSTPGDPRAAPRNEESSPAASPR